MEFMLQFELWKVTASLVGLWLCFFSLRVIQGVKEIKYSLVEIEPLEAVMVLYCRDQSFF